MVSTKLSDWKSKGEFIQFGPQEFNLFVRQIGDPQASPDRTLLLLHGFPESSYSYHAVLLGLKQRFDRIILFDMLGYGWSDKPGEEYSYSLVEQAESAFAVWKHFGIKGGHLLGHDMGDSVATEILARIENGFQPSWFTKGLQSITFTNGSMILELSELRVTQKILLSRIGSKFTVLTNFKLFNQQVRSAHGNSNLSEEDIQLLWEANTLKDGVRKTYLTIKYLNDRKQFEKTRWLPALSQTKIPIHLCWGDQDAVARVKMAHKLKKEICTSATLSIMKGVGHFCQMGSPDKWLTQVLDFYK